MSSRVEDLPSRLLRALALERQAITRADIDARTARTPAITPVGAPVQPRAVPDAGWRARANCLGVDPDLFYPERFDRDTIDAAKAVCAGCTVRARCLVEAIETGEDFGVWGGADREERRRMRRSLPRMARCLGCGERYEKVAPGQKYCRGCPALVHAGGRRRRAS